MSDILLSGFTFIRNAVKYDFPVRECIESMLPIVDELVVNVGKSDDGTEELIAKIIKENREGSKIRLVHSVWDDSKTKDGLILSEQTNIALDACRGKWCLYLQADEAIHEADFRVIRTAVEKTTDTSIEGFSFRYLHFYGGYSLVQQPWNWYPSEIRLVRRDSGVRSFGDAQTFRIGEGESARKLKVASLPAHIYHYGHARAPEKMQEKISYFHRFWHGDGHSIAVDQAYGNNLKSLVWFWGTHPLVYRERVKAGFSWSLKPRELLKESPKKIVIYCAYFDIPLAEEIRSMLSIHGFNRNDIIMVTNLWKWGKVVCGALRKKKDYVLIDLEAGERSFLSQLIFFTTDLYFAFNWRVAFVKGGVMSRWRQALYHAISWSSHEEADRGFVIPETQYARQVVRWLGIDC